MDRRVHASARKHGPRRGEPSAREPSVERAASHSRRRRQVRNRSHLLWVSERRPNRGRDAKGESLQRGFDRVHDAAASAGGDGSMNRSGERIDGVVESPNHDLGRTRPNERLHDPDRGRRDGDVPDDRDGRHEGHRLGECTESALRAMVAAGARVDDGDVTPSMVEVGHERAPSAGVADAMRRRKRALDVRERLRREVAADDHACTRIGHAMIRR